MKNKNYFDVILNMEIVEHVEDVNFLKCCSKLLKKWDHVCCYFK